MSVQSLRLHWERVCAVGALCIAVQLLLASWVGAHDSTLLAEEFPYLISGGLGAALLVGIACTLWLSGDLMDEWHKLAEIDGALAEAAGHLAAPPVSSAPAPTPWTLPQLLFTVATAGSGALLVAVGWFGASGQGRATSQLGWFALATVGVGVHGVGVAAHVLNGRRSIGSRHVALWRCVTGGTPDAAEGAAPAVPADDEGALVAGPAMTRYHRLDCPLVRGKAVEEAPIDAHVEHNRRPCGVCSPGGGGTEMAVPGVEGRREVPEMVGGVA